ncbi:MAG: hypothetical protein CUN51_03580 [Candidatus Thermofonsia Clade 1 bacterium]|uniref:PrcB C-terminal domain-containing protein n=1 Tax=Candidatus Thermofonsia Clade 1 bacterium TaxID=2364210 RepID=A0A2M8P1J8_9CHLR|nr:MAG: hypothetical protein CUN51_03580 [Candidatus Thermofonsia Clade 1 bacterium]
MHRIALWAALLSLAACQAGVPLTLMPTETTPVLPPTADVQSSIWLEQLFSSGRLAVYFYSADDIPCVRFLVDLPAVQPVSACATPQAAAVVAQGVVRDAEGQPYTIIAVRAVQPEVSVVVIELRNGESYPLEIEEGGALLILPEIVQAWQAVPIDSYGDTVGTLLRLSP